MSHWRTVTRRTIGGGLTAGLFVAGLSGEAAPAGKPETVSPDAPVLSQVKILEVKRVAAEVYGSFAVSDPNGDYDAQGQNAIMVVVFCTEGDGFWLDANAKAEKPGKPGDVVHFRLRSAENTGVGECDFTLKVVDKAGNVSKPYSTKVTYPK